MSKAIILNRAFENSGDWFIHVATCKLFKGAGYEIEALSTKISTETFSSSTLEQVNTADLLVIPGGPCISDNIYPFLYPLRQNLNDIKPKIIIFGGGLGESTLTLNPQSMELLQRATITTRDQLTSDELKRLGINNTFTGCSTWFFNHDFWPTFKEGAPKLITYSPSAGFTPQHKQLNIRTLDHLSQHSAKIQCIFNHGLRGGDQPLINKCNTYGFKIIDTSNGYQSMLDACKDTDLHIGLRVHSHIASLIYGIKSILLKIDVRGQGMSKSIRSPCDLDPKNIDLLNKIQKCASTDFSDVALTLQSQYKATQQWLTQI